jgi:FlaA1/EpsC-like NDP-sugar epimerase
MWLINQLINLSRVTKRIIMLSIDSILLPFAWWLALSLRYGEWWPVVIIDIWWSFITVIIIGIPIFIHLGLYQTVIRYMSEHLLWLIAKGIALITLLLAFVTLLIGIPGIPRTSFFIFGSTAFLLISSFRFIIRSYYHAVYKVNTMRNKVAIYGADNTGIQVATALLYSNQIEPVAFVDDNETLWGTVINGIRVYAPNELTNLITTLNINILLLAMPHLSRTKRFEIIRNLQSLPIQVRTIPGMTELVAGSIRLNKLREISIEDLLGREPVIPNAELLRNCIENKSVLVTGAGGSIGSELCRQILRLYPKQLVLFELSEFALYTIEQELIQIGIKESITIPIFPILGSIQNQSRVNEILTAFAIQTVYHAAAYKHVPLVEQNVIEGIRNNVFGTKILVETAMKCGVNHFVLISTDKAVRPTSIMGASKRLAELILQSLAMKENITTRLCMVRFGNVLESSGSVVPLFRRQIANGGPITLTHKEVTRYFMTIPEAAQLVIQAGAMARGGDVFVLDMGQPICIYDLACTMIHLSGLKVKQTANDGGIEIVITGLRPGEKLYEELLINTQAQSTEHPLIMRNNEPQLSNEQLTQMLLELEQACDTGDVMKIQKILSHLAIGYSM